VGEKARSHALRAGGSGMRDVLKLQFEGAHPAAQVVS
jgi:hypothetical protein